MKRNQICGVTYTKKRSLKDRSNIIWVLVLWDGCELGKSCPAEAEKFKYGPVDCYFFKL